MVGFVCTKNYVLYMYELKLACILINSTIYIKDTIYIDIDKKKEK